MNQAAPSFLHLAEVIDTADPLNQHRVKIRLLNRPAEPAPESWARMVMPYASHHAGFVFRPEIGDEVVVTFDRLGGTEPIVLGALYNGQNAVRKAEDARDPGRFKGIRGATGHELAIEDSADGGIALRTSQGHLVEINDEANTIRVSVAGGSSIEVGAAGTTLQTAGTVSIEAAVIKLTAGMVEVEAGLFKVSGVMQSEAVVTNRVAAASYTPGVGNIW